jgi:hypothetical protein
MKITRKAITRAKYIGILEIGENIFSILSIGRILIAGSPTNNSFLTDCYLLREQGESLDEGLQEMYSDLEVKEAHGENGDKYMSRAKPYYSTIYCA